MSLPEMRIVVSPYNGIYNKWQYKIQKNQRINKHYFWQTILGPGIELLDGYARTQEKALEKARKKAADYCEYLLDKQAREKFKQEGQIVEKVTCQEEPV